MATEAEQIDADLRTDGRVTLIRRPGFGDVVVSCLFDRYSPAEINLFAGGQDLIRVTDSKIMVSAVLPSGFVPDPDYGDMILDSDGVELRIITVTPEQPGNELLFYTIQARR